MARFHRQYARRVYDPPRPIIPAGSLILITGGDPEFYCVYGLYRALVDIDREAEITASGITPEEAET